MRSKIKKLITKIDELNKALKKEYGNVAARYGFSLRGRRVVFLGKMRAYNKRFRVPAWKYIVPTNIRHTLSIPFIYGVGIPVVILDIGVTIYQWGAFSLYGIPIVKRREYIVFDRQFLDYLNIVQKLHCLYCSYVNGVFMYAVEIGARTERYWCPIKAARKPGAYHGWYKDFADYGDPEQWICKFNDHDVFDEKCKK